MGFDETDIRSRINQYDTLCDHARHIAEKIAPILEVHCETHKAPYFDSDSVTFAWDSYSMGCYMGEDSFTFPLSWLWEQDVEAHAREFHDKVEKQKKDEEEHIAREAAAARDEKDRKEFLRLKAQFESNG